MRRIVQLLVFVLLLLPFQSTKAAFPYKFTISGPGLGEIPIEIWMADDAEMLRTADSVMLSELPGRSPDPSALIYEVDWWWGLCWVNSTPCTEDPQGASPVHSRYYFDTTTRQGYLYWIDRPSPLQGRWITMTSEFDHMMQVSLAVHMLYRFVGNLFHIRVAQQR